MLACAARNSRACSRRFTTSVHEAGNAWTKLWARHRLFPRALSEPTGNMTETGTTTQSNGPDHAGCRERRRKRAPKQPNRLGLTHSPRSAPTSLGKGPFSRSGVCGQRLGKPLRAEPGTAQGKGPLCRTQAEPAAEPHPLQPNAGNTPRAPEPAAPFRVAAQCRAARLPR